MARLLGSATTANDDSTTDTYPSVYIPVKVYITNQVSLTPELAGRAALSRCGDSCLPQTGDDHGATSFTIRYAAIRESAGGMSLCAANVGFVWSLFYDR
jgi:hypothetical protein